MTGDGEGAPPATRRAGPGDAALVADLLDAFNREFDTPTPGPAVLRLRLERQLAGDDVVALLVGEPVAGLAVLSFRTNVWHDGPVAVLDELYVRPGLRNRRLGAALLDAACDAVRGRGGTVVEINVDGEDRDARRFYEAHGCTNVEPGQTEPMLYYYREL